MRSGSRSNRRSSNDLGLGAWTSHPLCFAFFLAIEIFDVLLHDFEDTIGVSVTLLLCIDVGAQFRLLVDLRG